MDNKPIYATRAGAVEDKVRTYFSRNNLSDYEEYSIEEAEHMRNELNRAIKDAAACGFNRRSQKSLLAYFKGRI